MVVLTLYRINRDIRSSSCFLSGIGIAKTAAVFPVAVAIADELLSAVLAGQGVERLLVHIILVAVPVSHAAAIIAVPLLFAPRLLFHGSTAVLTQHQMGLIGMPLQIGFHSIGGDPGLRSDPLISISQTRPGVDSIDFFVCHICLLPVCREALHLPAVVIS